MTFCMNSKLTLCFAVVIAIGVLGSLRAEDRLAGQIIIPVAISDPDGAKTLATVDPNTGQCTPRSEKLGVFAISHAGEQLAYMAPGDGWIEVRTTPFLGGMTEAVAHRTTGRCNLVWSPDAKWLLVDYCAGTIGWEERDKQRLLAQRKWLVKPDGSEAKELKLPFGAVHDWSPDGKWLAMVCPRPSGLRSRENLFLVRSDASDERQLTNDARIYYPQFSPDGRRIAYYNGVDKQLWTVQLDGQDARPIKGRADNKSPLYCCWSPDSTHLAVTMVDSSVLPNVTRLDIVKADGSDGRTLELKGIDAANLGRPQWRAVSETRRGSGEDEDPGNG